MKGYEKQAASQCTSQQRKVIGLRFLLLFPCATLSAHISYGMQIFTAVMILLPCTHKSLPNGMIWGCAVQNDQ